jgi:hypothetical protein
MFANPRKTKTVRSLGVVDIAALRAAAMALPEEIWDRENATKPNRFGALDEAQHIVFRFVENVNDWRRSVDLPMWGQWRLLLEPVMASAVEAYGYSRGAFPRVMLARLKPGGVIHPHRDLNPSAKWPHKIHVPLQTNPLSTFYIEGAPHHLAEAEAVEVNNMDTHSVRNVGAADRVHLIFEYFDLDQPDPAWVAPIGA